MACFSFATKRADIVPFPAATASRKKVKRKKVRERKKGRKMPTRAQSTSFLSLSYSCSPLEVKLPGVARPVRPNYRLFEVNRIASTAFNGQSHESLPRILSPLIVIPGEILSSSINFKTRECRATANEPPCNYEFLLDSGLKKKRKKKKRR